MTRLKTVWMETAGRLSPRASIVAGMVLLLVIALIDWTSNPLIGVSIFYLVPIALVTWKNSRRAGLCMAVLCGGVWLVIEFKTNKLYSAQVIPVWNAVGRTLFFCLVSALMSEVLRRKRVEQSLRESERQVAEVSEREQRRIGEDLHDGLCQQLVGIAFAARKLAARLSDLSLSETKDASEIAQLLGDAISQARDAARGLYLVQLEADGLASALDELAAKTRLRHKIACRFVDNITSPIAGEMVVTSLFRIAREAVNNAIKHAQATKIIVTLTVDERQIRLDVEDNGRGLPSGFEAHGGLGLQIMNYRAQMIQASFNMVTRSDGGVRITCLLSQPAKSKV